MFDMEGVQYLDNADKYLFFEPKPENLFDDETLEGCLAYAAKVDQMVDK